MAAIITEKFRTHNARQFIEDFSESGQKNYVFIGRSHAWADDTQPPPPARLSLSALYWPPTTQTPRPLQQP